MPYTPLTDTDQMMFGKHKGRQMLEVPTRYLNWMWNETSLSTMLRFEVEGFDKMNQHTQNRYRLARYIEDHIDEMMDDEPDLYWDNI